LERKGDKVYVFYPFTPPAQSDKNFDPRQFLLEKGFSKILVDEKSLELAEIESSGSKKLFKKGELWILVDRFPKEESEINRCSEAITNSLYHHRYGRSRLVVFKDRKSRGNEFALNFHLLMEGSLAFQNLPFTLFF
jgi:excinuclease UvrABC ATPase subunit